LKAPCRVIVLAKAPLPGFAKTRLIPALGADGAAALARRLFERTLEQALLAGLGGVEVCCAPSAAHAWFAPLANDPRLVLTDQGEGDLGERMARAIERALAQHAKVILIGTDIPALDAAHLRDAAAALDTHDAVFTPALDGGYVLVGLRRPARGLFDAMPWSTGQVMQRTRERLAQQGLSHAEGTPLADIDEPADLLHLPPGWL
jgi:uncharacterized protein